MKRNWRKLFTKKKVKTALRFILAAFEAELIIIVIRHMVEGYEISFHNYFRDLLRYFDRLIFYGTMFFLIEGYIYKKRN